MKVLLQRVSCASVETDAMLIAEIGKGYVLFVAFTDGDRLEDAKWMANKIAKLRVFPDESGKMNRSIIDVDGEIMSISQFTLYADLAEGNRPSFTKALDPNAASALFLLFNDHLTQAINKTVKAGRFGAHMNVDLTNDGPVTILLER